MEERRPIRTNIDDVCNHAHHGISLRAQVLSEQLCKDVEEGTCGCESEIVRTSCAGGQISKSLSYRILCVWGKKLKSIVHSRKVENGERTKNSIYLYHTERRLRLGSCPRALAW